MAEKKRYPWTERTEEMARFDDHLRWASAEVKSWPLWKQNVWRGGPNRPLATEVIPLPCTKPECLRNKALVQAFLDCHAMGWGSYSVDYSYPYFHKPITS